MCVIVVSLTGSICMMRIPVSAAQSTIFRRSTKSPIPRLCSVRRENTGMATPVPFHPGRGLCRCIPDMTTHSLSASRDMLTVRLSPVSQPIRVLSDFLRMTNLYS